MAFPSSIAVCELPLFPLGDVVLFPGQPLPLHIFEYRYRIMMNTILDSDRRFGVLMVDPVREEPARIGCCAEIVKYQRLPDGRLRVLTLGQQRFQVLDYVREKPYYVGLVEWLEDATPAQDLGPLADEVSTLLKDVVRLSAKLMEQDIELPDDLPTSPTELSYWIGRNLSGASVEQQMLLEMLDTEARLRREADILSSTRNHLAAKTVLKDTLSS
ncbi:LON peptidase substrate-binding domain-containing protein [Leptolyngbya sp. FACHB-261]|uniref:LON peptidase substrate-binding domain-containing protein n=1 Tax=Leptolyngbya sp. FACHB-261 TaxID=2692806 RepID=UPI0016897058|nr:LON peptidase substrate-binding domain-containing protein [Leptolyngbya sp. FACHB-261]MBD2104753.1 LON peptidase substrate-binding domain-containing protein [Leptolyngbya sp. FACHB-261]